MVKHLSFFLIGISISIGSFAQTATAEKVKLYNPLADAKADMKTAIAQAVKEGKFVLLEVGGNWCSWCYRFEDAVNKNDTLKIALQNNFVMYHLNYSSENKNEEVMASLGYPQRFGFPVFVILDSKGTRLHTQNSAYLEEGKGYDSKKILEFFNHWSPTALDPKSYEKK